MKTTTRTNQITVILTALDGSGYTVLREFTGAPFDGGRPSADLVLSGSTLYGTTPIGGSSNLGTVFMLNTNGGGYALLKNLIGHDGAHPVAGMVLSGSTLCGTTADGGDLGLGTVFKINLLSSPAPRLSVTLSNASIVIFWPSPSTGFLLQQNTNVNTTNWVTPAESVTDNSTIKSIVVDPTAGNRFYRLLKP